MFGPGKQTDKREKSSFERNTNQKANSISDPQNMRSKKKISQFKNK